MNLMSSRQTNLRYSIRASSCFIVGTKRSGGGVSDVHLIAGVPLVDGDA
jgi:hypothetical protein